MKDIVITKEDERDFEEFAKRVEKITKEAEEEGYKKLQEHENKKIYCPINDWDCPYWKKDGTCSMREEEGVHPKEECDDYALFDAMFDGLDDEEEN